jgi:hypothetical protein
MNIQYTVRYQGRPIKTFTEKTDAHKFLLSFLECQMLASKQLAFIDEAVLKSNLSEANTLIKHIMEKK